jgi:hypothetical protein
MNFACELLLCGKGFISIGYQISGGDKSPCQVGVQVVLILASNHVHHYILNGN